MNKIAITLLAGALALAASEAGAQTFSARRMGMGGVVLGATGENVAYRAVPAAAASQRSVPLPLGLIPVIANPPQFDASKPDFNIYEIANLLYNPPWNLQITRPAEISNDITISISQSSLAVDLGEVKKIFPADHTRIGAVINGPSLGFGIRPFFVGVIPVVQYDNDISLNAALHGALADGQAFVANTEYAMFDKARAQVALGAQLGCALPLMRGGDQPTDRDGLYAGTRIKLLRGIAYGDADNKLGFITGDTLFANPVDINYVGYTRRASPSDGGFGAGLDLGAVWVSHGLELGLGINDIATRIGWKVRESVISSDTLSGAYVEQVLRDHVPFTSRIPTVVTANAAYQLGPVLVAGDIVNGVNNTQGHVGAELWTGSVAVRGGISVDATREIQGACGTGFRFGRFGVDLALSSHSRNLSRERALELGAGLTFYR